jgi:thioredoxin-related protein
MPSTRTSPMRVVLALAVGVGLGGASAALAGDAALPPPTGPVMPRVVPIHTDDGLYRQSWFQLTFLDLREDFADAKVAGKRLAVLFEQRGCVYCASLHNNVLAARYINDYMRENFAVVQLDLWGAREVTDFDGTVLPERALAERWGVIFTPTIVFLKDDLTGLEGKWGRELEAIERLPLSFSADTFYDLVVWVRLKLYERDRNFQRFHITRMAEREALKRAPDRPGRTN